MSAGLGLQANRLCHQRRQPGYSWGPDRGDRAIMQSAALLALLL